MRRWSSNLLCGLSLLIFLLAMGIWVRSYDADSAMNAIWQTMLDYLTRIEPQENLWEPTHSIYLAFDAGEWDHGDGKDPVEQFTRPQVKAILSAHNQTLQ